MLSVAPCIFSGVENTEDYSSMICCYPEFISKIKSMILAFKSPFFLNVCILNNKI